MARLLSALSALVFASSAVARAAGSSSVPSLKMIETIYESSQSTAGVMFDIKAKGNNGENVVVYGLDVNFVDKVYVRGGPSMRVLIYTREGTFKGHEGSESGWDLWMNTTVVSSGLDEATPVPQTAEEAEKVVPLLVGAKERRAFYVSVDGPYLRYSDQVDQWYYQNGDISINGAGAAKRKGWDGATISPRLFNGALHYYTSDTVLELPGVQLLPAMIISQPPTGSPIRTPTSSPISPPSASPSRSQEPTTSIGPTAYPTQSPTKPPSRPPTSQPTSSPISYELLTTQFDDLSMKPVLVYAGFMMDIKGRNDIEVSTIAFNTYVTTPLAMQLYIRQDASYKEATDDIDMWTPWANVTVEGQGMGNPTFLPKGSFEPILVRAGSKLGIYLTTDGPYLRASKGDVEGKPHAATEDLVVYQGVGKRYPMTEGTISPRIINCAIGYVPVDIPTPSPTIDTQDLWVANTTFAPTADTYIQRGKTSSYGNMAQMFVDGSPERVALMKFDISSLNVNTKDGPDQILSAVLRLYSMQQSDFGGYVSIIPGGDFDEDTVTWDTVPYGRDETGTPLGQFRSVWPDKYYEIDITEAFRGESIPQTFVIRISSDVREGAAVFRSRDGGAENGPRLVVNFAYDADTNKAMAQMWGSNPPTQSPTIMPEWEDAVTPSNPLRTYFKYDPRSSFGPNRWDRVTPDGYYDRLRGLRTDTRRNRCEDGRRQSPQNLCETNDQCLEFHETRPRRGEYGLGERNETIARPTPTIEHNKLRLTYKERRSEMETPIPPGADFARNGFNSGIQDLVNIDIKVRSEHRLCGKQYDGEYQLFYLHRDGNLEAISILIEADGEEHNGHFQKMLDFFQQKFDADERLCQRKQQRARALFDSRSKLRGGASPSSHEGGDQEREESVGDEATASFASTLYKMIRDRFLAQRRDLQNERWDPLEPWAFYRSIHFWSYSGSITEPPCFEDVKWRVTDVPMKIHHKQYIQLKKLMFDHVDPDTCQKTSTHFEESNARPIQPNRGGAVYRCRRSDYASDMERAACNGRVKGCVLEEKWWGVDNFPYIEGEFPNV